MRACSRIELLLKLPLNNLRLIFALSAAVILLPSCASVSRERVQPALHETQWISFDGKQMPWRAWPVSSGTQLHAVIIAVHGLSGAASDFVTLGERLPAQGIAVYAYEMRGQGNDSVTHERGDIADGATWMHDLMTFHRLVHARHPGVPIVWYGESLGSLIALHTVALHSHDALPDALILASPLAGTRQHLSDVMRYTLRIASHVAPQHRVTLGALAGVDENKIQVTSTSTHGGQMALTPHRVASFSLRLLREIDSMMQRNAQAAQKIELPVLMLASPHDVVASPDQVQTLFKQLGTHDKKLLWYAQSYHLLLHDVQREAVVEDVHRWLRSPQSH